MCSTRPYSDWPVGTTHGATVHTLPAVAVGETDRCGVFPAELVADDSCDEYGQLQIYQPQQQAGQREGENVGTCRWVGTAGRLMV
jgi:hypothetical protein